MKNQNMDSLVAIPHIDELTPLNENDTECVEEIKKVLMKHNALNRFGLTLLHDHFEIADDEILLETCDAKNRTLTIKPVKSKELADTKLIETNWRLDSNKALLSCTVYCSQYPDGHQSDHIG